MIKMDLKGITWVGNVYQKFEAMCLEVEEVMYEDTVKYVGNQVHTIGASVKKFYSEIMQDGLNPSSIDPVKLAAADLSLNPYAGFKINKKPKSSTTKDNAASHKFGSENLKVKFESNENCGMELILEQNRDMVSNGKSRGVTKRISRRENRPPVAMPRSFAPLSKDLNEMGKNYIVTTDQIDKNLCSNKISHSSLVGEVERALHSGSVTKKEQKLRDSSSQGPTDVSSAEINGACEKDEVDSVVGSYICCHPENNESSVKQADGDVVESEDDILESNAETIQEFEKSNCVLVGREDFSVAALKEDKPRSYKKKIRKAFSSKRSTRKQEYKQLAMDHGCLDTGLNQEVVNSTTPEIEILNEEKSPPHRTSESEWEIL